MKVFYTYKNSVLEDLDLGGVNKKILTKISWRLSNRINQIADFMYSGFHFLVIKVHPLASAHN